MSETLSEVGAVEAVAEPAAPEPVAGEQLAGGAAAGEATAGLEPAAPAAPETPTIDPAELQAELEFTRGQLSELTSYLQQQEQPQQGDAAPGQPDLSGLVDEFGQITPEGLVQLLAVQQQSITQQVQQALQQVVQPMEQQRKEQAYNAGLESANDMLGDNVARLGEFASDPAADKIARDRVLDRAEALMPEIQGRFGSNPRAAEIAIARAADEERQYLNSVRGQGAAAAANRLSTLAGAASEPGAGATGGIAGVPAFTTPAEVKNYYAAEARRLQQEADGAAA